MVNLGSQRMLSWKARLTFVRRCEHEFIIINEFDIFDVETSQSYQCNFNTCGSTHAVFYLEDNPVDTY